MIWEENNAIPSNLSLALNDFHFFKTILYFTIGILRGATPSWSYYIV